MFRSACLQTKQKRLQSSLMSKNVSAPSLKVFRAYSTGVLFSISFLRMPSVLSVLHIMYGLSRRRDGSHHHEWDLLWARSPIRERHIRWQIWHSKLLVGDGPDLHRSRLDSTPECVVFQTFLLLTCTRNTSQLCPSRVLPIQKVRYHSGLLWTRDSPCIICTVDQDAGNHDGVVGRRSAWEFV